MNKLVFFFATVNIAHDITIVGYNIRYDLSYSCPFTLNVNMNNREKRKKNSKRSVSFTLCLCVCVCLPSGISEFQAVFHSWFCRL